MPYSYPDGLRKEAIPVKVTRHREKIIEALQEWFRVHKEGPTLEELCIELEMQPRQKATLQRWLQTMRGVDVEWEDHVPRTLHLIREEPVEPEVQIPVTETLRYLARGLAEWEKLEPEQRANLPQALRLGMSRMYLTSLLQKDETAPESLPEFFQWAETPVIEWTPAQEIQNLSSDVTLIEDGLISDFAHQWLVTGEDVERQVQEKVLQDVLEYCRANQLDESYRVFRKLITERPVIPYKDYRRLLSKDTLRPLRNYLQQAYVDLVDLSADRTFHFCPRCQYIQRQRSDGSYGCRNTACDRLSAKWKLPPQATITREQAETMKVVTPGIYRYGTIPGLWEIHLAEELSKLGVRVTLWPQIDEFDLLVEFSRKLHWAIDVKDWSYLDKERLQKVQYRPDAQETFIVFPDSREQELGIKVRREKLEPSLNGIRLKLISEVIAEAKTILQKRKKNRA
ncbi:MAG: Fis family transcriptional regulator [Symploca sp. SIO3E6]|nr:Fis family transcriptional regulator [Caldora sp. SIO3E6]